MMLGDFSAETIQNLHDTLENYKSKIKMATRTKLYIITKKKSRSQLLSQLSSSDDDDFEDLPQRGPKRVKEVPFVVSSKESTSTVNEGEDF